MRVCVRMFVCAHVSMCCVCVCVCVMESIEYHSQGSKAVNDRDDVVLAVERRPLLTSLP